MEYNKIIRSLLKQIGRQSGLVFVSLLLSSFFLLFSGYHPMSVVNGIIDSLTHDIAGTIRWSAPIILAGLAICVTHKAKFFNLGVDGQIYMGAAAATAMALKINPSTNPFIAICMVFFAAAVAGILFAMIPALMKIYLNSNEVVSTLLLNFVAVLYIEYLVTGPLMDKTVGIALKASAVIPKNTFLPRIAFLEPSSANIGFYIAIAFVIIIAIIFFFTSLGYEIKVVGENSNFAKYGGINESATIIKAMTISGVISGIIGAIEVTAIQRRLLSHFNPAFGFDGIVVALLSNNNPIGAFFSGFFLGALKNGGINMERSTNVPSAITSIVMAIIIITISAKFVLRKIKHKIKNKIKGEA